MQLIQDPRVSEKFNSYPKVVREQMDFLRQLVLETATETEAIEKLEETLKWGEPSYLTKTGSTLRMDWKAKTPDQYAMYFKCTSKLVPTFKEIYKDLFNYENNRAIVFKLEDPIPVEQLKKCIAMTLLYHKLKHLELLGAGVSNLKIK